jgi:acyl-homoserine lactone acylase PvdQ
MPISIAPGEITTPEFQVNLNTEYTIRIEAKKTIPFDTLNCLLGMSLEQDQKCSESSVIEAKWVLTSMGDVVGGGESGGDTGGAWANDTISRELGSFSARKGKSYIVHVRFTRDGRALAPTDPHLVIEVRSEFYEGNMVNGLILMAGCTGVSVLGLLLLLVSFLKWFQVRRKAAQLHII